jgi:hypothetical protein
MSSKMSGGRYIMIANGSVYHTRNCLSLRSLPNNEVFYVSEVRPTKYGKCIYCVSCEQIEAKRNDPMPPMVNGRRANPREES